MRIRIHLVRVIAILAIVLSATILHAEECADHSGITLAKVDVASRLAKWIATKTGWRVEQLPRICLLPERALVAIGPQQDPWSSLTLRGLYSARSRTIFLPNTWDPLDLRQRSDLLHELVHYLQALNKIDAPCLAAHEAKAFELQLLWLREQGVKDPYELIDTDALTIVFLSRCPE